jgi:hypothetical protein
LWSKSTAKFLNAPSPSSFVIAVVVCRRSLLLFIQQRTSSTP